tara:strand:+ start:641 stop:1132 length:492 start_codon:yes stop_codon:yes gene_type:complete
MSDNATANISASIFESEIKAAMRGNLDFNKASTATGSHKWLYASVSVNSTGALLGTGNDYMADGVAAATGDIPKFIAIKNTGTTNGSTATTDGVNILLTNTTVAYNTVGSIFIDAGEMVILKLPATTINTIGAVSVTVTNGMPSADSSSAVLVKVATLMDDVG